MLAGSKSKIRELLSYRIVCRAEPPAAPAPRLIQGVDRRIVAEVLNQARELISEPGSWAQGHWGQTRAGWLLNEPSDATLYPRRDLETMCSETAVIYAAHQLMAGQKAADVALDVLHKIARTYAANFNDSHSHREILALFRRSVLAVIDGSVR